MNLNETWGETLRMDVMTRGQRIRFLLASALSLGVCFLVSYTAPNAYYEKEPFAGIGENYDLRAFSWRHGWIFGNKYSNDFGLYFTPTAQTYLQDRMFVRDVRFHLELYGTSYEGEEKLLANESVTRSVSCELAEKVHECSDVYVFWENFVSFESYRWVITLLGADTAETDWLDAVTFMFRSEGVNFAVWQVRINYLCFGISVVALIYWFVVCRFEKSRFVARIAASSTSENGILELDDNDESATNSCCCGTGRGFAKLCSCCCPEAACPYRTPTQKWVLALVVGAVLYNQPFYGFQYLHTANLRYFFLFVSIMMQFGFIAMLFAFWLGAYESMYSQGPYHALFYAPKIAFAVMFWLATGIVYAITAFTRNYSYTYDWTEDSHLLAATYVMCISLGLVYLCCIFFVCVRAGGRLLSQRSNVETSTDYIANTRVVYFVHFWHICVTCVGIFLGLVNFEDVRFTNDYYFFQFFFTFYIWEIMYLYQPVPSCGLSSKELAMVSFHESSCAAVAPRETLEISSRPAEASCSQV